MIVQIKTRDDNGRYCDPSAFDFAMAAFAQTLSAGGWFWLRSCLARFCVRQAENNANDSACADSWYRRYQALRNIP